MSKFLKLSEINRDIDLLESHGDFKSASILHKKFVKMAQETQTSSSILTDSEEKAVYVRIINQIKDLLKRNKIPEATKLSNDYNNWFDDRERNSTFEKEVENLFLTLVNAKPQMGKVNTNSPDAKPSLAPLKNISLSSPDPINNSKAFNTDNQIPTKNQNQAIDYYSMKNIEKLLKDNPKDVTEAQSILDHLIDQIKPPIENDLNDLKRFEKEQDKLYSDYFAIARKYMKQRVNTNPVKEDTRFDPTAKSTPEQAKNSALWQKKWYAIYNSKLPRMQKYKQLMYIHEVAKRLWEKGKISAKGYKTFSDLEQKTASLNTPYPIPGDPGFVPEII